MGEETLAQNWQFAVRFRRRGCRLRRLTTTQPPRLDYKRSPASASSGRSITLCCLLRILRMTNDTSDYVGLYKMYASSPYI